MREETDEELRARVESLEKEITRLRHSSEKTSRNTSILVWWLVGIPLAIFIVAILMAILSSVGGDQAPSLP